VRTVADRPGELYGESNAKLASDGADRLWGRCTVRATRQLIVLFAAMLMVVVVAGSALAQEGEELDEVIDEYTQILPEEEEQNGAEVLDQTLEAGEPVTPTQVLGVQQRLAVTGTDLAIIAGLGALLLALGFVAVRAGRRSSEGR
jgi:hypothetical protein